MNKSIGNRKNKSKKGFTLIELLVVIALIGVLGVMLTGVFTTVSRSYMSMREKAQAISLANDLLNGVRDELKKTDAVFLGYLDVEGGIGLDGTNGVEYGLGIQINKKGTPAEREEAMQLELQTPPKADLDGVPFFDKLSGMIYQSNIVFESKKRSMIELDMLGSYSTVESKYYGRFQITGLHFDVVENKLINITRDELISAGFTQINNILQISFDIKTLDGKKTLFSVEKYNLYLDNLIANLYKTANEDGNDLSTGMVTWEDLGIYSQTPININPDDINDGVRPYDLLLFTPRVA